MAGVLFEIQVPEVQFRRLSAAFEAAPAATAAMARDAMAVSLGLFEEAVVDATPVGATGILRGSIMTDIRGSGVNLTGRVFSQDQPVKVASVETGRRPGRMPPWRAGSALHLWVVRKLGGDERTAFLVARVIGRRGTTGARMFERGFTARREDVLRLWDRAVTDLIRRLLP